MKSSGNTLYEIGENYIKMSTMTSIFPIGKNNIRKIQKNILSEYQLEKTKINNISNNISSFWKNIFFSFPQINNVIISFLQYTFNVNFYKKNANYFYGDIEEFQINKVCFLGDIIAYILQVINKYFNNYPDNEIIVIKTFLEILSDVFNNADFLIFQKENKKLFWYWEKDINDELNKFIYKINYELRNEFILTKPNYNHISKNYISALKKYYKLVKIYMLGDMEFNKFYIPPVILKANDRETMSFLIFDEDYKEYRKEWKNIFLNNDIIYLTGGPGFGKTLFLKYIISNINEMKINYGNDYLLLYCDLKNFYTNENKTEKPILDFLQDSMLNITGIDKVSISKDLIQYYLSVGRCILLLDSLDEVPKLYRENFHKKLINFFTLYCNPNNKICITTRDRGFIPKENIETYEILSLKEFDIKDYVNKMINLGRFNNDNKENFMKQANVLMQNNFLTNFLILTLLISIFKSENRLPTNKINLYRKCFDYIARERELNDKNVADYKWKSVAPLLKDSTFISFSTLGTPNNKDITKTDIENLLLKQYKNKYNNQAEIEFAIKEFLQFCSERTDIFIAAPKDGFFKFFHRSFFDYFYSKYIYQCSRVDEMFNLMKIFDLDSEVFELTVALIKEDNELKYQDLIDFLFDKTKKELKMEVKNITTFNILTLIMQVVDDAYYIQQYFDITINNYNIIIEKTDNNIQTLICKWINNAMTNNKKNLDCFEKTFETLFLKNIFLLFSNFKPDDISYEAMDYLENAENYNGDIYVELVFAQLYIYIDEIPFYCYSYASYFNIYEKAEAMFKDRYKKDFFININEFYNNENKAEKGMNVYKSLKKDIRERFCKILNNELRTKIYFTI